MRTPTARRLDAHLARVINQIRQLRQKDLSNENHRRAALDESLEILRTLTMYRGMLKNVTEMDFAPSTASFKRALDKA